MEQVMVVKGFLNDERHIILNEPIQMIKGEVEIIIRSIKNKKKLHKNNSTKLLKEIEGIIKQKSITSFKGIDGLSWEKKIRKEWE